MPYEGQGTLLPCPLGSQDLGEALLSGSSLSYSVQWGWHLCPRLLRGAKALHTWVTQLHVADLLCTRPTNDGVPLLGPADLAPGGE